MMTRMLAAGLAAAAGMAGFTAVAAAGDNIYATDSSGTTGGTPSKPKAATLNASFTTGTTLGATFQPKPVIKFVISIEGYRLNRAGLKALVKCKPTPPDADDPSADQCAPKSVVGRGVLNVAVGAPESVINPALACALAFKIYNVGPDGLLALFIDSRPPVCPIPVRYWVPIKTVQRGRTVVATIDVPSPLRELGPDVFASIVKAEFTFKPIKVKIQGTPQSVTESIGCADSVRTLSVAFTDINGGTGRASKDQSCR